MGGPCNSVVPHIYVVLVSEMNASLQVYLILDEFIMGGELQETSKKVT